MNVVREINKINERELALGVSASWHDEYKDSAYIFIGGLHYDLTEGDVITIFSQYGEVMDVNLPRDKKTGKTKGFGFLMYEDQRSTVLAVDNLNGADVLGRTLRVDHVRSYKQPKVQNEDGEWVDAEEQNLSAKPQMIIDDVAETDSDASSVFSIDPEDPMRDYLIEKRKEMKALEKSKKSKKGKHKDETPDERRARKERKREKKLRKGQKKSEGVKGAEMDPDLPIAMSRKKITTIETDHRRPTEGDPPPHLTSEEETILIALYMQGAPETFGATAITAEDMEVRAVLRLQTRGLGDCDIWDWAS
ncbi:hypothetical protein PISMIDRAFT_7015 [Pisolithus microcarpus 441]|uniref:RRM domain-containing protein n=1 Tax=Pisolithus microcarpus 441 TaxID=765257 RepID=A0A0C9YVP4_9AGAM|nr:hypothetical protein BKA83DRAFT_7015 [Pisolithus microcarpus]KIK29140.1 hypothetical protein PISMIDRAFT_7015 [Pisolithus microcarpus 441]